MQPKLSGIIKEMACVILRNPAGQPSSEAAHAALLMAHVAWNRAIAAGQSEVSYRPLLREFEASNRLFWHELTSTDAEVLIAELVTYKRTHYPYDRRQLIVCGMIDDKVHVEWRDTSGH